MRKLSNLQTMLFGIGGALMVVGAGMFCFLWQQIIASILFLIGAVLFGVMQCMQTYDGNNFTIKRLKKIMNLADLVFIIAGILMVDTALSSAAASGEYTGPLFLRTFFSNLQNYYTYVYNRWLPLMLIGVVLEFYTTHRISSELKKEEKKD